MTLGKTGRFAVAVATLLAAAAVQAQDVPGPAGPGVIGSPSGVGPRPAVAEVVASLPNHVVYHPQQLSGAKLPVVLWGNGACRDNGLAYAGFLRNIASHGYLVLASGKARGEPTPGREAQAAPAPPPGVDETAASLLTDALDWAQAENKRKGSVYRGRIDTAKVAVMGHSCGGLQALSVANDPRITTAMIWNSGVYNRPGGRSGIRVSKEQLNAIRVPIAYVAGGPEDIAYPNAADDFARIGHVPVIFANAPVGHGGTFHADANGGDYGKVAVGWLDWRLKGRRSGAAMFRGTDCGLCRMSGWTVQRKRID
jgi:dienelactone hydrolase